MTPENKLYYVYHIATPTMGLEEGYVGISTEPKSRWSRHKSERSDSSERLKRAIKKYNPDFKVIGVFDSLNDALWQESTLRPFDRMGWNLVKGGGMPPSKGGWNKGKPTPKDVREKQSKARQGKFGNLNHPRCKPVNIYDSTTHELIAESVVARVWAKQNGYHQAHLSATASGKLKSHKGIYARYVSSIHSRTVEGTT